MDTSTAQCGVNQRLTQKPCHVTMTTLSPRGSPAGGQPGERGGSLRAGWGGAGRLDDGRRRDRLVDALLFGSAESSPGLIDSVLEGGGGDLRGGCRGKGEGGDRGGMGVRFRDIASL